MKKQLTCHDVSEHRHATGSIHPQVHLSTKTTRSWREQCCPERVRSLNPPPPFPWEAGLKRPLWCWSRTAAAKKAYYTTAGPVQRSVVSLLQNCVGPKDAGVHFADEPMRASKGWNRRILLFFWFWAGEGSKQASKQSQSITLLPTLRYGTYNQRSIALIQ